MNGTVVIHYLLESTLCLLNVCEIGLVKMSIFEVDISRESLKVLH